MENQKVRIIVEKKPTKAEKDRKTIIELLERLVRISEDNNEMLRKIVNRSKVHCSVYIKPQGSEGCEIIRDDKLQLS